jgi:hypothetical protein
MTQYKIVPIEPTYEMIDGGLKALLKVSQSELEAVSPKLLSEYTDEVTRTFSAMLALCPDVSSKPVYQLKFEHSWIDVTFLEYEKNSYNQKRILYTTPQPDRVAELESKLKKLQSVLSELVKLKEQKDSVGKTPYYHDTMPLLWAKARSLLAEIKDK